jgi:hypothetical protein
MAGLFVQIEKALKLFDQLGAIGIAAEAPLNISDFEHSSKHIVKNSRYQANKSRLWTCSYNRAFTFEH